MGHEAEPKTKKSFDSFRLAPCSIVNIDLEQWKWPPTRFYTPVRPSVYLYLCRKCVPVSPQCHSFNITSTIHSMRGHLLYLGTLVPLIYTVVTFEMHMKHLPVCVHSTKRSLYFDICVNSSAGFHTHFFLLSPVYHGGISMFWKHYV